MNDTVWMAYTYIIRHNYRFLVNAQRNTALYTTPFNEEYEVFSRRSIYCSFFELFLMDYWILPEDIQ